MGSLGVPEMVFIFVLALLLFGPKKLPEVGRTLGKAMSEFRRASSELKATFDKEMQTLERETESIKEAANDYHNDTYNYDYSSYGTHADGVPITESEHAAIASSESASATQGAELPPGPEGAPAAGEPVAEGSEPVAHRALEAGPDSGHSVQTEGDASVASPAEHKA